VDIISSHIMDQWLKCVYVLEEDLTNILPTTGVPQGGPISPCVCNLVMNGIQEHITGRIA
jgi:retron-type reverse transcriptase